MQAVILAAGRGTRLMPLTENIPKALVPVSNKPMLEIILQQLKKVGVTDVVIIVHHLKGKIMNYCAGSPFGVKTTCVEQIEMKGTADAVLHAEPYIKDDKFLCIAVDSLFETDLLKKLLNKGSEGVITCKKVEDAKRFGVLKVEGDKVLDIIEKPENPPSNLANFSVYVFPKEIFAACKKIQPSSRGEYEVTDAIKLLIDQGKIFTFIESDKILDVGTHEQLKEAEELLKNLNL